MYNIIVTGLRMPGGKPYRQRRKETYSRFIERLKRLSYNPEKPQKAIKPKVESYRCR